MEFKPLYTTKLSVIDGREGYARMLEGQINLKLTMPTSLGGAGVKGSNPEELFAACVGASMGSTLKSVCAMKGINVENVMVDTTVTLGRIRNNGFGLTIHIDLAVQHTQIEKIEAFIPDVIDICTYTKSLKDNVKITWEVQQWHENHSAE